MKTRIIISLISILIVFAIGFLSFFFAPDISEWITGKTTTARANILETPDYNCSVVLTQGINFVSFPCEPEQYNFTRALSNEDNETLNFNYVFTFNPNNLIKPWHSYKHSLPNWTVQNIPEKLDRRRGYVIYMEEAGVYHAEGLRFGTTNIQLKEGWNLVGYPSDNIKNVTDALSSIQNVYLSVYSYQLTGESKTWVYHIKDEGGTLEYFIPGYAYWIEVEQDTTWVVEW